MRLRSRRAGQRENFIHGPLVIRVRAVLTREDHTAWGDQEVCRQTQTSSARSECRQGLASTERLTKAPNHSKQDGNPNARIEQGSKAGFDTEILVESFVRVRDCLEGQRFAKRQQVDNERVKDDDFANGCSHELGVPPDN